jgi:hypothetical protein
MRPSRLPGAPYRGQRVVASVNQGQSSANPFAVLYRAQNVGLATKMRCLSAASDLSPSRRRQVTPGIEKNSKRRK